MAGHATGSANTTVVWSAVIVTSATIGGCATPSILGPVDYRFVDVPAERRIEVSYRNLSRTQICLLPEQWPNQAGKINQASDIVVLVVGSERFPIADFDSGYCPQGCATRVAPGQTVTGSIPYAEFGIPERLRDAPKELEFSPRAFPCR